MKSLNKMFKLADRLSYKYAEVPQASTVGPLSIDDFSEKFPEYFSKEESNSPIIKKLNLFLNSLLKEDEFASVQINVDKDFGVTFDVATNDTNKQKAIINFLTKESSNFTKNNLQKVFSNRQISEKLRVITYKF